MRSDFPAQKHQRFSFGHMKAPAQSEAVGEDCSVYDSLPSNAGKIRMKLNKEWPIRLAQIHRRISNLKAHYKPSGVRRQQCWMLTSALRLTGVILVAVLAPGPSFAQKEKEKEGFPEDWSHHHVVFSNPGTIGEAAGRGSFDSWYKVVTNPRFTHQLLKRRQKPPRGMGNKGPQVTPLQRDWSATLGGAGVAPDMFPAKWQFSPAANAASCSDYVVFPVNKAGVLGSQPNIVAYDNLYVNAGGAGTCPGTTPTVLFSYFVGTGTVQTSPTLGGAAGQVAYVESIAGGSKFHVLKGAGTGASKGTVAAPVAPGTGNSATDVALILNGGVSVTRSSPFYDFAHDAAYVGDDSGKLHKITPVFNGAPAEVVSAGANVWPATVSTQAGEILTPPVFDDGSAKVFVGDSQGFLYSVNSTTGSGSAGVLQSAQLGNSASGIVDSPLLDPSAETLYVFVSDNVGGTASAVFLFNTAASISASSGTNVTVGTSSTTVPVYDGTFDNIYFTSANGGQPAGNLYVCGNAGGNPTLYIIPITYSGGAQHMGAAVAGPAFANSNVGCSPLTEFYNSSTSIDWLFGGVGSNSCGASPSTAGGCVLSFNITTALTAATPGPWTPDTAFALNNEIVDHACPN
jgi:hypothetical protein